jgi:TolB-like protein/Tfp pilus assembly protein PilF
MIRRDGFVKVLDFGIAKLTDRNATGESQAPALRQIHTAEGSVVGTAPYMSPEQARGLNVDARTDVWGLGVVLYEALAGCQPFPGETTADIVNSILEKNPAPLNRYSSVVPEALQLIVSRTLLKDREARYQTARELLADLKELRTRIEIALISGEADIAKHLPSRSPAVNTQAMPAPAATTNASTAEFITTEFKRHKFAFTAGVTLLLAGLVLAGFYLKNRIKPAGPGAIQSLAVLPFKNDSGNNDLDYLSEGMTETLINSLSRLPNVLVKSPSAVSRFRAKEIDPKQAGLQLSVDAILIGRVVQRGDDLTLYLSLVNAQTGDQLWGERYLRKLPDLAALQTEIARDVSERVRPLTGNEKQVLTKGGTANSEAYLAYIKGNYYWQNFPRPGYEKSREYFQQAIDLDPTYAMGYTGLAHYYGFAAATGMKPPDENWSRSEDAVNKALALDNTLAETHNARVGIQLYYHRDWREAEQSFRRGVELNPNSSEVHNHYGRCLILFDRTDEAIAEMKRAVALEPLSLRYNQNLATLFFFARQYDQALAQLRKTLELEPNFGPAHEWLGNTYEQKGMQKEAFAEWTAALKIKGESEHASNLEQVYAASGFDAAVRFLGQQQLKQVEEMSNHGDYVAPVEYVLAYTRLGNKEKALEWLDKAVDVRDRQALEFKVNPLFDSLRGDQRFQAALQRIVISK